MAVYEWIGPMDYTEPMPLGAIGSDPDYWASPPDYDDPDEEDDEDCEEDEEEDYEP